MEKFERLELLKFLNESKEIKGLSSEEVSKLVKSIYLDYLAEYSPYSPVEKDRKEDKQQLDIPFQSSDKNKEVASKPKDDSKTKAGDNKIKQPEPVSKEKVKEDSEQKEREEWARMSIVANECFKQGKHKNALNLYNVMLKDTPSFVDEKERKEIENFRDLASKNLEKAAGSSTTTPSSVETVAVDTQPVETVTNVPTEDRADSRNTALDLLKARIMEKVVEGIKDNYAPARKEISKYMVSIFPETEIEVKDDKDGIKARNKLMNALWIECTKENAKKTLEEVKIPVTSIVTKEIVSDKAKEVASVINNAKDIIQKEEKTTVAPTKIPPKTLVVSPEELETAIQLVKELGPSALTEEELPSKEDLRKAIAESLAAVEDPEERETLKAEWVKHIKARKDAETDSFRRVKEILEPGGKTTKTVDFAAFYVDKVEEKLDIVRKAS